MERVTLGRTGLVVGVAGLGCGGFSRLGLATGGTEADAVALVHAALDQGVDFFDTARSYRTEHVLGEALRGRRHDAVIATKAYVHQGEELRPPGDVIADLHASLAALRTDHVDIFQIHAPPAHVLPHAVDACLPELVRAREAGKIRHIGISGLARDHRHETLLAAAARNEFEVMLVAFHMMHQSARTTILPVAREKDIGVHVMYAVRNIFARPEALRATIADLCARGLLPADFARTEAPLDFLVRDGGAASVTEAAYRFVRGEPGVHVVLFGTGDRAHLQSNVEAILKPPLPPEVVRRLHALFGHLEGVGLERPPWRVGRDGRPPEIPGGN